MAKKQRRGGPGPRKPPNFQPARDGQGVLAVRWEVGLEPGSLGETPRSPEVGRTGREVGTAAASVLGDLAVVFRMDTPA